MRNADGINAVYVYRNTGNIRPPPNRHNGNPHRVIICFVRVFSLNPKTELNNRAKTVGGASVRQSARVKKV